MLTATDTSTILYHDLHLNEGSSEWLLLIHGAGGSTRTWKRQIEDLSSHFNLLVIDLPGHGKSAELLEEQESYTFEDISKQIWEVVDSRGLDKVHVLGVSLGAIIALNLEALYSERVKSLVLAGAIVKLNRKLKTVASFSLFMAKVIGYRRFYKMAARIVLPRKNHKTSRQIFIRESQVLTNDEFRKWTEMYKTLNQTLTSLYQAATEAPRLLLMGAQDHLFLQPALEYVAERPYSSVQVVDKCGHVVNIERWDAFNEHCIHFIQKVSV